VNDAARVASFSRLLGQAAVTKNTLEIINGVAALYARADGFDYDLAVVLVGQETFETDPWSVRKVGKKDEVDSKSLLREFDGWSRDNLGTPSDNRMLLSGHDFDGRTAGVAHFEAICSDRSSSANMCPEDWPSGRCSYIAAHELGHNLGMHHDGFNSDCPLVGYIMGAEGSKGTPTEFSTCSMGEFNTYMRSTLESGMDCLLRSADDSTQSAEVGEDKKHADALVPPLAFLASCLLALAC